MRRTLAVSLFLALVSGILLGQSDQSAPAKPRTLVRAGHILNVHTGEEAAERRANPAKRSIRDEGGSGLQGPDEQMRNNPAIPLN
jgi:hypothetical protein